MTRDLRPVLEAVIFADDVTAAERLKAIEQLRELDGEHVCPRCAVFDPPPDPDGFWEHTDDLLSSLVPFLDAQGREADAADVGPDARDRRAGGRGAGQGDR